MEQSEAIKRLMSRPKPVRKNTGEILQDGSEEGMERELDDVFAFYDRKKQGKLSLNSLEEVVGSLGIALPPPEKREAITKIADPSGTRS